MRLYHGSPARKDRPPFGSIGNTSPDIRPGRPFFVTQDLRYAEHFARGGLVTEIHAQLSAVADLRDASLQERLLRLYNSDPVICSKNQQWDEDVDGDIEASAYVLLESPSVMRSLIADGFTAVVMDEDVERGVTSYALLCASEVISVSLLSPVDEPAPYFEMAYL